MTVDKNIIFGIIGAVLSGLFICWIVSLINKKERFLEMEKKQDRNESNERYEIMPESLYENQNASSPYPPEPMIPFQIYQPQDIEIDILKVEYDDDESKPETNEDFQVDIIEIQSNQQNNQPVNQQNNQPINNSTFCTCGGLIHQTCASPAQRVNNYNKGLTEFAKLPNKNWQDVMPYDQWTDQPNYYKQNTNWYDVMPYDIYQSKK